MQFNPAQNIAQSLYAIFWDRKTFESTILKGGFYNENYCFKRKS